MKDGVGAQRTGHVRKLKDMEAAVSCQPVFAVLVVPQ
jgi:hypothetical protein